MSSHVDTAVQRARSAANWWGALPAPRRRRHLLAFKRRLAAGITELADLIRVETGKPTAGALLEVMLTIEHLDWAARRAERVLKPRSVPSGMLAFNQASRLSYVPYGVVGVIGPWNYPFYTPMGSISHALAAGNAVVFKPSEFTPRVGAWLADRWTEVLPDQPVLQVVTGDGEAGAALARAGVDKIAFTGSVPTGRKVMQACSATLTPVLLELGGKDATIVAEDADLDAAADALTWGGFWHAGQACVGVERVYVVESVREEFLRRMKERAERITVGLDELADYGPMTMPGQIDIVRRHVSDALERGGTALVGGLESIRLRTCTRSCSSTCPRTRPRCVRRRSGR